MDYFYFRPGAATAHLIDSAKKMARDREKSGGSSRNMVKRVRMAWELSDSSDVFPCRYFLRNSFGTETVNCNVFENAVCNDFTCLCFIFYTDNTQVHFYMHRLTLMRRMKMNWLRVRRKQ